MRPGTPVLPQNWDQAGAAPGNLGIRSLEESLAMKPTQQRILLVTLLMALLLGVQLVGRWSRQASPAHQPTAGDHPASDLPEVRRLAPPETTGPLFKGGRFGDVPIEELIRSRDAYYSAVRTLIDFQQSKKKEDLLQAAERLRSLQKLSDNLYVRSSLPFDAWCREQLGDTSQRDKLIAEGVFAAPHYRFLFSQGVPEGAIRYQMRMECQAGLDQLARALRSYEAAHSGRLPTRIEDLQTESPLGLIHCPASQANSYYLMQNGEIRCRNHPPGPDRGDAEQSYKVYMMILDGFTETERLSWRWDDLVAVSGMHEGQTIADVGCGPGLFTFPMAEKVGPRGKVYAVDINRSVLDFVAFAAAERPTLNIETVLTPKSRLSLPPASVELITVIETYHAMLPISNPTEEKNFREFLLPWLRTVRTALRPGGLLVVGDGNVDARVIQQQVSQAGLEVVKNPAPGVTSRDTDYFSVFRRPTHEE